MDCEDRFVLTDLPSEKADGIVTNHTHRCRGCAGCISSNKGTCAIDDDFTNIIPEILSHRVLEIRTGIRDSQFRMPMRKAVERLSNVLQAFTDAGGNIPLDKDSVALREIDIIVDGVRTDGFETYARELLDMGPVEEVTFRYE